MGRIIKSLIELDQQTRSSVLEFLDRISGKQSANDSIVVPAKPECQMCPIRGDKSSCIMCVRIFEIHNRISGGVIGNSEKCREEV